MPKPSLKVKQRVDVPARKLRGGYYLTNGQYMETYLPAGTYRVLETDGYATCKVADVENPADEDYPWHVSYKQLLAIAEENK